MSVSHLLASGLTILLVTGCTESSSPGGDDAGIGLDGGMDGNPDGSPSLDSSPGLDGGPVFDGGPDFDAGLSCQPVDIPGSCVIEPAPLRVIPSDALVHVLDEFGVSAELNFTQRVPNGPFVSTRGLGPVDVEQLLVAARTFAESLATSVFQCEDDDACREYRIVLGAEFVWHRRLANSEREALLAVAYDRQRLEIAFMEIVLAPDTLFLYEGGEGETLSRHERVVRFLATALRYPGGVGLVEAIVTRPSFNLQGVGVTVGWGFEHFHRALLGTQPTSEDAPIYPRMLDEQSEFFRDAIRGGAPTFRSLFSAPYTFVDDSLAAHYGLEARPGSELTRVALPAPRAGGLLGQGAFTTGRSRISRRGTTIATNVLCRDLPPPPAGIPPLTPSPDGTERERWEAVVTTQPECQVCHVLSDTFGFGLLNYDEEGRYQETESGQPVDSSFTGVCIGAEDTPPSGEGAAELIDWVANSVEAHDCYGRQWERHMSGREVPPCAAELIDHRPGESLFELFQRNLRNDALYPRDPRRRSVARSFEFVFPSENAIVSALEGAINRVRDYRAATDVEEDQQSLELYESALRERLARAGG